MIEIKRNAEDIYEMLGLTEEEMQHKDMPKRFDEDDEFARKADLLAITNVLMNCGSDTTVMIMKIIESLTKIDMERIEDLLEYFDQALPKREDLHNLAATMIMVRIHDRSE